MTTDQTQGFSPSARANAALALSGLVIIGAFGPWISLGFFSVSGMNTGDGKLVFGMGVAAVVASLLLRLGKLGGKGGRIWLGLLGLLIAAACVYDLNSLGGTAGWGIYLDVLAGIGLVVLSVVPVNTAARTPAPPHSSLPGPPPPGTPASWLPDVTGRHHLRYWNGTAFTEHVSDSGVASIDPT